MAFLPNPETSISEWSQADPETWTFASSMVVLGGAHVDPLHALGAALHLCLVGDLLDSGLPSPERFDRLIRSQVGRSFDHLEDTICQALPRSMKGDGEDLARFVVDALDVRKAKALGWTAAQSCLLEFERTFSSERLAAHWRRDGRDELALVLLAASQDAPPKTEEPLEQIDDDRWCDVAMALESRGDYEGALDTALKAVASKGAVAQRVYLGLLMRSAQLHGQKTSREKLITALGRLERRDDEPEDETVRIQTAHIGARYLDDFHAARRRLVQRFRISWNQVLASVIGARLHAKDREFNIVSRLCGEGLKALGDMPDDGGYHGRYARSYLCLLDGIANLEGALQYNRSDYLSTAIERLSTSLVTAETLEADDLVGYCEDWLGWLVLSLGSSSEPAIDLARSAAFGLLTIRDVVPRDTPSTPPLPWYNQYVLLPY